MIECTRCGICCTQLDQNPLYAALDRGDGTCRHFNQPDKSCAIYANRPDICNSEIMFRRHFSHLTPEAFIAANRSLCESIQAKHGVSSNAARISTQQV